MAASGGLKTKSPTLIFFPLDYKKVFFKIFGRSAAFDKKKIIPRLRKNAEDEFLTLRAAKIRKKTGKPGEIRLIPLSHVVSVSVVDEKITQKRWYKAIVVFSPTGIEKGQPKVGLVYIYLLPTILDGLTSLTTAPGRYKKRK